MHPLNTEVIDYVTQRTESTMGLFYLLTLYAAMRVMSATARSTGRWYAYAFGPKRDAAPRPSHARRQDA